MSTKVEVLLDESEYGSFVSNMRNRGFKKKAEYLRFLIEQDNPFLKSVRDEMNDLRHSVKSLVKYHNESLYDFKKLSYLNYKALLLLLGYFADANPSEDAIESVKRFVAEKEREFEEFWRNKNRKR